MPLIIFISSKSGGVYDCAVIQIFCRYPRTYRTVYYKINETFHCHVINKLGDKMIFEGDILIFDLDGTLVKSSAFDDDLYQQALREVLGHSDFNTNWETYEHVTDTGLLHELLSNLGVDEPVSVTRQVRDLFGEKIRNYLDGGGNCEPIPGAIESLNRLLSSGFKVGIATGGWGHTARMKLRHAGFSEPAFLSSCDDAMDRPGIMVHCCENLGGNPSRAVYFGDASWDVKATQALGWRFVGVGEHFSGLCAEWISDFHDPRWPLSPNKALNGCAYDALPLA